LTADNKLTKKKVARAVLHQLVRDLGSGDRRVFRGAIESLQASVVADLCEKAEYPSELLDTLRALVSISRAERKSYTREVIELLKKEWGD
jgi:hypothetical protein